MGKRTSTDSDGDTRMRESRGPEAGWRGDAVIRTQKAPADESSPGLLTLTRRALEERWVWRAIISSVPTVIGASILSSSSSGSVVGGLLIIMAVAVLVMPVFSPERVRRRMLAVASSRLPDTNGWLTIKGTAGDIGNQLLAPYSERPCLAYWARRVVTDAETGHEAVADDEQRLACCDFAVDVDGQRVLVDAREAYLAYDRSLGEIVSNEDGELRVEPLRRSHCGKDRTQEILLRAGDCVVVRGQLVRGADDEPYRAAARIVPGARRRVAIVLAVGTTRDGSTRMLPRKT